MVLVITPLGSIALSLALYAAVVITIVRLAKLTIHSATQS